MPKMLNEWTDGLAGESNLLPVLDHLAWLGDRVADKANNGRAFDAALLTYNAAVMLEWRLRFPLGDWVVPPDSSNWAEAAKLADDLAMSSRAIIEKLKTSPKKEADAYRPKLRTLIRRVLKRLPDALSLRTPKPTYMSVLNESPNVRFLMQEFLDAHRHEYADAIKGGSTVGEGEAIGSAAVMTDAVARLTYVYTSQGMASRPAELRRSLGRMAVGFLETVVDDLSDGLSETQRERWRRLVKWYASSIADTEVK